MLFNPVKCHVKWRSFAWPSTDQTPSADLLKPPTWSLLLFSMASTFYHMIIELLATPSNFPSTPAPWLRGESPISPCWTAGFHHFTSISTLSQHLQGIQGLRPFLYSSHNVLDTAGHVGFDQNGESAAMPAIRTLWSAQQCRPAL